MMTPQEKANELVEKFKEHSQLMIGYGGFSSRNGSAKECALIAIDFAKEFITGDLNESFDKALYLFEVKEEIEKL